MSSKRPYEPPRMTEHGSLRTLTQSGAALRPWSLMIPGGGEIDPPEPSLS